MSRACSGDLIGNCKSEAFHKLVHAGGLHLASNSSDNIEYYHQDHLGSTRLKTNSTGGVVYESNYEHPLDSESKFTVFSFVLICYIVISWG